MTMNRKFRRIGTALMVSGVLLIVSAGLLVFHNLQEDQQAEQQSTEVLQQLTQTVKERVSETTSPEPTAPTVTRSPVDSGDPEKPESTEVIPETSPVPLYVSNPEIEMPTIDIDGNAYIGWLDIPALSLSLPVMSQWSYANLNIAPCRYSGSAYLGNLVIAAHNYKSHFRNIKNLTQGDEVRFTDADGNEFLYQVAEIEQLSPIEVKAMEESGYPLTLFTCTVGGSYRVAVRCSLIE
jgi:sortase A